VQRVLARVSHGVVVFCEGDVACDWRGLKE
jgi:hypothetical protein